MRRIMLAVGAIVSFLACLAPAAAAERDGQWETSAGIVFQNSADADFKGGSHAEFDSDTSLRLAVDYHYTGNLAVGFSLGLGTTDYEASLATDIDGDGDPDGFTGVRGDFESTTLLLNGTYNFMSGPFSPFVTGGIGWSWVDTNIATEPPQVGCWWDPWFGYICSSFQDTRTLDGLSYQIGAGARYDFSETLAIHGSYRISWIDIDQADGTPSFDGFELSVGWKF